MNNYFGKKIIISFNKKIYYVIINEETKQFLGFWGGDANPNELIEKQKFMTTRDL